MKNQQGGQRRGAGRPKVADSERRKTTTVSLSQWVLDGLAEIEGGRSENVEKALIKYFKLSQ